MKNDVMPPMVAGPEMNKYQLVVNPLDYRKVEAPAFKETPAELGDLALNQTIDTDFSTKVYTNDAAEAAIQTYHSLMDKDIVTGKAKEVEDEDKPVFLATKSSPADSKRGNFRLAA